MSKIDIPYRCVGCDHLMQIKNLAKPTPFKIVTVKDECPNCGSGFEMRVIKPKVAKFHNHVQTTTVIIKPSEKLVRMLKSGEARGTAKIVLPT